MEFKTDLIWIFDMNKKLESKNLMDEARTRYLPVVDNDHKIIRI